MGLTSTKVLVLHCTQHSILRASRKLKMGLMSLLLDPKIINSEKLNRNIWIHITTLIKQHRNLLV